MRKILILADDLSGSADCANACMHSGLSAVVALQDSEHASGSDVLSIDCDTRHLPREQAFTRVAKIMRAHADDAREQLVFKKVDSTLRGNIADEIRAILEKQRTHGAHAVAVFAPAFPACGRTTIDGYQLVHGVPLHETEMWINDGLLDKPHIPTLLENAGLRTAAFDLLTVRLGHDSLAAAMRRLSTHVDILICDAQTDEDLHTIAQASLQLGPETVWVGSAGLAYQLPLAAALDGTAPHFQKLPYTNGPMLFVVGSMSSVSHRQAAVLEREAPIHAIRISPQVLMGGSGKSESADVAARISQSIERGQDTLVVLDAAERVELHERRLLTNALGVMLSPFAGRVGALAATGGETARAIFNSWKVRSLKIVGEVERGIPCSSIEVNGRSILVLTKAGGFGDADSLLACWRFLASLPGHREPVALRKTL